MNKPNENYKRVVLMVPEDLHEEIRIDAIRQHKTLSQFFLAIYAIWRQAKTEHEGANNG
ncbi:hypothetical protein [Bremerella sp. P1]|uniref:hypothetical protein n=1 Tax=Bremerella sp. P1 TaxID=3026424 RepID=UPI0023675610|nr:hypothetical protein [Bremerella sp. P1]WDI41837.1 hypothetical protein PSR63_25630 [Bremerella sp. P1]